MRASLLLLAITCAGAVAAENPGQQAAEPVVFAALAPSVATLPELPQIPGVQTRETKVLFGSRKRRKGAVCGDIDIKGVEAGDIAGTLPGCGASDAVRVREISGVRLSQSALMTCGTAKALKKWIGREVETAFGRRNKVVSLRVAAHYACRTRNNRPGARISEHGRGKAIDISGFTLESGETITVLDGWKQRKTRRKLKKIWKAACGPFGTVLGPEADRYHRDHFHLDIARHRGGAYCR
ncbi:extensin-like domain-containing protein [Leisingera sp. ANG-M1]|uniref:extensin-like domain-containing protein n=1 Tax=Leisingera sp. ANG-M1 TaxID=1577895 RepID=UPI00406CF2D4